MLRLLGLSATLLALGAGHASGQPPQHAASGSAATPLPQSVATQLKAGGFWHRGCPVPLSHLRLLTVSYRGFDGRSQTGPLVVNEHAAQPLARVFRKLYSLHFPIRRMSALPLDGDVTASFSCRQAVPSPCVGGRGTGSWSMHAYGLAVDVNPRENPYVGCGQSRDPATRPYFDRSHHRRGMVTPRAIQAFRSVGWGWGGSWIGNTKDYMHFSSTGH
ncbi:MAG: M15 family metallopeptidase [Solirubrobacteraceae bacterium]